MADTVISESQNENNDDIGIGKNLNKKNNALISILLNVLWVFAAIALIIGSFWISFLFGRRVLLPIKKTGTPEIVKKISVPVVAVAKDSVPEKPLNKVPFLQKKITVPNVQINSKPKEVIRTDVSLAKLYRVQIARIFKKEEAINLMKYLQSKEFDVFAKNSYNEDWIVQIGAFKDRSKALKVIRDLKNKGIKNKVVIKEEN